MRMIVAQLCEKAVTKSATLAEGCALVWQHPQVRREVIALLDALGERLSHVPLRLSSHPEVPLAVHARYTRIEVLAFTLDKTTGHFSPRPAIATTRWAATQRHVEPGSAVMLFARLRSEDRAFYFLGPARYVKHDGELPMAVTWRLERGLPS